MTNTLAAQKKARRPRYRDSELSAARARRANLKTWSTVQIPLLRHRAKNRGLECSITAADIPVPIFCPVLGTTLKVGHGSPNSPSVDRFDNSMGYVPGNVRVISRRANRLKGDATVKEMQQVLAYMEGAL